MSTTTDGAASVVPRDRVGAALTWVTVAFTLLAGMVQILWLLLADGTMTVATAVVAFGCLATAVTGARFHLVNVIARVLLGSAFLGSVADRLGLFGGPGSPGVTWGEFGRFVEYTGSLLPWLPAGAVPTIATLATSVEVVLGSLLIIGFRARWSTFLSGVVLVVFAAAMLVSLGFAAMSAYGVPVLAGGAFVLATTRARGRAWFRRSASGHAPQHSDRDVDS